jgi:hypothetical protein
MKRTITSLILSFSLLVGVVCAENDNDPQNIKRLWDYKGYIGLTPVYVSMFHGLNLGFGLEGELAFKRLLTIRGNYARNYFEMDRSAKRGYIMDFGLSFHPIEWVGNASYSVSRVDGAKEISYDGGKTWKPYKDATVETDYNKRESLKRICFRAGLLSYRHNYEYENSHGPNLYYVNNDAAYLGLSYYKVALKTGERRNFIADVIFQRGIEIPDYPMLQDSTIFHKGIRLAMVKAGDMGGGTYEIGAFPGVGQSPFFYFKVAFTINAVFIKGFKW